jgi:hypothetical protein
VVCDPLWSMATSLCRQVDAPHRSDVRLFGWEAPRLGESHPTLGGRLDRLDAGLEPSAAGRAQRWLTVLGIPEPGGDFQDMPLVLVTVH